MLAVPIALLAYVVPVFLCFCSLDPFEPIEHWQLNKVELEPASARWQQPTARQAGR